MLSNLQKYSDGAMTEVAILYRIVVSSFDT
jgi:hypothetical protein